METALEATNEGTTSVSPQLVLHTPKSSTSDEQSNAAAGTLRKLATCNLCRRRKVKCDKANPCSNCLRAGVACVSTTLSRVPRGRQGSRRKPDGELLKRIAKLENLVKNLEAENGGVLPMASPVNIGDAQPGFEVPYREKASESKPRSSESSTGSPKDHLERYLSSSFWVTLSDEVRASLLFHLLPPSSMEAAEIWPLTYLPRVDQRPT
jgi:Fungal Zn(2)-Cys(6) binuclear cluster domain